MVVSLSEYILETMTDNERILFCLLRSGLDCPTDAAAATLFRTRPDWNLIYGIAVEQGVLAVAYDGLNALIAGQVIPAENQPERTLKIKWGFNVMKIEQRFGQQKAISEELARKYAGAGVRTIVLKGLSVARHYPRPDHRPCGDLDCFLPDSFERGNEIALRAGATVEDGGYKHAHVFYKGLMVENHRFCTPIRNGRRAKDFERRLQELLRTESGGRIPGSDLECASPLFNGLFLTAHAWNHFLNESISLRHLCDWVVFLVGEGGRVAWNDFADALSACDRGSLEFAKCMTLLAHDLWGVEIPRELAGGAELKPLSEKLLHSILHEQQTIYNKGFSAWKIRLLVVRNALCGNWKFKAFSEYSALHKTLHAIWAFLFERNPHL